MQLPDFNEAARSDEQVTDPVDYPRLCDLPWSSTDCWKRVDVYEDVAEGNKEIAQLNADIARDSDKAYDYILDAAKRQQQIALIREEMLEKERRDHFIDNVERGIAILVLALALIF